MEGISSITPLDIAMASELGFRIKLLGVAERNEMGIEQRVHPTMVPKTSAIAQVMGVTNAVTIDADAVKELTLIGPGAGGDADRLGGRGRHRRRGSRQGRPSIRLLGRPAGKGDARADAAARRRLLHPPHGP